MRALNSRVKCDSELANDEDEDFVVGRICAFCSSRISQRTST